MKYQVMPDLTPIEYEALKADIAERGVLVPVEVDETGAILDGHHRVKAWQELRSEGVNVTDYPRMIRAGLTEEQKRNHARSLNVLRRHLSKDQRDEVMREMRRDGMTYQEIADKVGVSIGKVHAAASGVELFKNEKLIGADGKARPASYERRAEAPVVVPGLFVANEGKQNAYLEALQEMQQGAPDLYDAARTGDMKITEARRQLNQRQKSEAPPLPTSKYRVIYADPPWKYNNSGAIETANGREVFTRVEQHYPTMSIEELCAMGPDVRAMADDDAVLFLWTTSAMLEVAFDVINAWGFKYKTSVVWNKVRHTWGPYVSVRHELLLICTRGSCTPDASELPNSVQSIERSDRNSEKPEQFRQMIDQMYTHGRRIELFSRTKVSGWEVWGNEC